MRTLLRLIRTEAEYNLALSRIDELMGKAHPGTPEGDELEVLALIVEDYEEKHFPLPNADPIEAIQIRMKDLGLKQKDMLDVFGHEGLASQVLRRKLKSTVDMIMKLHKKLGIPLRILVRSPIRESRAS